MRAAPLQNSFSAGEFSPLMYARVDLERYKQGTSILLNYKSTLEGPAIRRPGTRFVAETKDSDKISRTVRFEFSTTQAYVIEFGDLYVRFFKDNGQIESSPGVPYEVTTPYAEADVFGLKFTQSVDVLYITHPSYAPRKLTRTGHTSWTLAEIEFLDGPYLPRDVNGTIELTPSGTTGSITVEASADLFVSTDVGRIIRMNTSGSEWSWVKITAYTDPTHVTALVKRDINVATATTAWRLGLWSETTGYPTCAVFHEDRLWLGGPRNYPQRLDGSNTGDYENFAPTKAVDGTIIASHAVAFSLNSNDVNNIRWMVSDEQGLLVGTVGGEWSVRPSSTNEALSATNVSAKRSTSYGSENIQAMQLGKGTLFVERGGLKIREMTYFYDANGFRSTDITALSKHITESGIKELCFMPGPQPVLYAIRNDGVAAGATYDRDVDSLKVGWHRHILGGYGDEAANPAAIESATVIPATSGGGYELWMIVKRLINGTTKRYVEYLTPDFTETTDYLQGNFVDCGLTYDVPKTITNISNANPAVATSVGHGFNDGDTLLLSEILGCQEAVDGTVQDESYFNGRTVTVANKTADTFELLGESSEFLSGYLAGGVARKHVTTISGLSHLEGESVQVTGDGANQADQVVNSGSITLAEKAAVVHVGFKYNSDMKLLRFEAGSGDGTALGKKRRTNMMSIYLHRTLGMKVGMSFSKLNRLVFRSTANSLGSAPPLYSGIFPHRLEANYDFENEICIRQDLPGPGTILAVMPQMMTQDAG